MSSSARNGWSGQRDSLLHAAAGCTRQHASLPQFKCAPACRSCWSGGGGGGVAGADGGGQVLDLKTSLAKKQRLLLQLR
jgi:hypothetical protein